MTTQEGSGVGRLAGIRPKCMDEVRYAHANSCSNQNSFNDL